MKILRNQKGATAIEYGLIASLVAVAMAVSADYVGKQISAKFDTTAACVEAPSNATCKP